MGTVPEWHPEVEKILAHDLAAGQAREASVADDRGDEGKVQQAVRNAVDFGARDCEQARAWTRDVVVAAGRAARTKASIRRDQTRETRPDGAAKRMLGQHPVLAKWANRYVGGRQKWLDDVAAHIRRAADEHAQYAIGITYQQCLDGAIRTTEKALLTKARGEARTEQDARDREYLPARAADQVYRALPHHDGQSFPGGWSQQVAARVLAQADGYNDMPASPVRDRITRATADITAQILAERAPASTDS